MNFNPISAWLAQFKLYLFGALLIVAGFAYWYHGHAEYKAGKAAGDREVTALTASYTAASEQANAAGHAMQSMYDSQAITDARQRALASEFQLSAMTATAQNAQAEADHFAAQLKEARKHDPTVAHWLDAPIPDGVRAAGEGGSR